MHHFLSFCTSDMSNWVEWGSGGVSEWEWGKEECGWTVHGKVILTVNLYYVKIVLRSTSIVIITMVWTFWTPPQICAWWSANFWTSHQILMHSLSLFSGKSCGDPGVPKNGYRKGNRYNEGSNIRFYCRHGFKIQGSRLRMCLEPDLKWTGVQPQCIGRWKFVMWHIVKVL